MMPRPPSGGGLGGWRVGRVGGIEVRADPSLLVIAALVGFNVWVALSDPFGFPSLSEGAATALAALTALLFVLSILGHELAHAFVSRARGIGVRGITLYMLGGATHQTHEPRTPGDEFLVTVVGPAATAAIGGAFLALHVWGADALSDPWRATFGYLALVNLLMAAFNVLPAFPLDGGHLVLAGVWRVTHDRVRALRISARIGQGMSLLLIAISFALLLKTGDVFVGLWPALIGWNLYQGASAAVAQSERRRLLDSSTARDVMAPPPPTIGADTPVGEALTGLLAGSEGQAFPVVEGERVIGFVSPRMARAVALDGRVRDAMIGTDAVMEAEAGESMGSLAERLAEERVQTVLVTDGGRLVGVIEPEDLSRFYRSATKARRTR